MVEVKQEYPVYKTKTATKERIKWLQDRWEQMGSAYKKKDLESLFNKIDKQYHNKPT